MFLLVFFILAAMKFDYTYIKILGFPVYEPMVLLTNLIFFIVSWYFFRRLRRFDNSYARYMSLFIFLLGLSAFFGAIGHGIHYQLGHGFFSIVLFLMNALSLLSIYYCFLAPFSYVRGIDERSKRYLQMVRFWVLVLLALCIVSGDFLLIKINAGIVLLYSLITHHRAHKTKPESGNRLVVFGIIVSFVPIIIHSLKISLHEWFNYKDLAHVFMILSLVIIFLGAIKTSSELEESLLA